MTPTIAVFAAILQATAPAATAAPTDAAEPSAVLPVLARHEGLWCGVFRRFDPNGTLAESFPTEIVIRFPPAGQTRYEQVNRYFPEGRSPTVIASEGAFDGDRIRFDTPRVRGWAVDDRADEKHRTVMLFFEFLDGSGSYFYEAIQLSDDGARRHRVAQYFAADGTLTRRTLVDETRQSFTGETGGEARLCETS